MNKFSIGFSNKLDDLLNTKRPYLLVTENVVSVPRSTRFDIHKHSFNPLAGIDYKKARDLAALLYSLSPQGENTLTVRNGRRALAKALLNSTRLDRVRTDDPDAQGIIDELLFSPLLRRIFCGKPNFKLSADRTIIAHINRADLGETDALLLGNFLALQYQGQIVFEDFGFYGRPLHISLIRQNRLVAGLQYLDELPKSLQQALLGMKHKTIYRVVPSDADALLPYLPLKYNPAELTQQSEGEYKWTNR
jgi:hypothetical protein